MLEDRLGESSVGLAAEILQPKSGVFDSLPRKLSRICRGLARCNAYWIALATLEKALLAFDPTSRIVPTTRTRITASMTAYSAMSCPSSSTQSRCNRVMEFYPGSKR